MIYILLIISTSVVLADVILRLKRFKASGILTIVNDEMYLQLNEPLKDDIKKRRYVIFKVSHK